MHQVIHLENKKVINILAISGILLLLIVFLFDYECVFLKVTGVPCVSCGLTRGFIYILKGDLINAIKINLLSIPIFINTLLFYFLYFIKIILKKEFIYKYYNYFIKHYKIIITILIINWIINIVKYMF